MAWICFGIPFLLLYVLLWNRFHPGRPSGAQLQRAPERLRREGPGTRDPGGSGCLALAALAFLVLFCLAVAMSHR